LIKKLAIWDCGLMMSDLLLALSHGVAMRKVFEGRKSAFSALKMGLTGIAAWSAQASGRARSIPLTSSGFCDQRRKHLCP
jgi:hypothetical protein